MNAVILVGGEGTRLRPLTLHCLKSTVPMAGHAFLEYPFALLRRHGIRDIVLSICHLPDKIKRIFGDGRRYGVRLRYAIERRPLGTGGAVKNAQRLLGGADTFVVLNGDILMDLDLTRMAAVHRRRRARLTIGLTRVEDPSAYGLVLTDASGRVRRFVEKPNPEDCATHWINAGAYLFDRSVLDAIPEGAAYSAERGLFPSLLAEGARVWSYASRGYWMDIGTPAKYLQAHADLLEGRMPMLTHGFRRRRNALLGAGARIHASALVQAPALIGDRGTVGAGARIGPLGVLGPEVRVGERAHVERSVIWERTVIGEGAQVVGSVLAAGCRVGKHAVLGPGTVLGPGAVVPDYSKL